MTLDVAYATFLDLWDELLKKHSDGDFAVAYQIALQGLKQFPEERHNLQWARICLAARMNDADLALSIFDESLQEGDWFGEAMLRGDSDLASLQGMPRFEDLVTQSSQVEQRARAEAKPFLKVLEPEGTVPNRRSLLVGLYGNVANVESAAEVWGPAVRHGWTVALPQSSQIAGPNLYLWNDEPKAFAEIRSHISDLLSSYQFDLQRRVIGGFSRGAQVGMRLAMSGEIDVTAFLAVCPSIRDLEEWKPFIDSAAQLGTKGYIIAGENDKMFVDATKVLAKLVSSAGIDIEVTILHDIGHRFPPDFERNLPDILEDLVTTL